ncbi:MAG: sigma-70 family RNA polymerase sigma factor [Deltaproteobacteria bacterium]|nr:sigma-70 family RNA polymerase sigma factor [Deltaproteobacteria bacterium]
MTPDEQLLQAWRSGDKRAGNELFQRYFETVRRFFANKVDDDLEDLVQRTFIACVEGQQRFEGRSEFRSYLLGIARHLLWKHWEARRTRGRPEPIDELSVTDLGAGPSSLFARSQDERRLLDALRRIPLRDQLVLEFYYWEELSGSELGEVLGVSEETARSRLRRAKLALGKELRRLERFAGVPESTDDDIEQWARRVRDQGLEGKGVDVRGDAN